MFEVGSPVAIDRGYGAYEQYVSAEIIRVTPSGQLVVRAYHNSELRFTKEGREMGTSSRRDRLVERTTKIDQVMRKAALVSRLKHTDWSKEALDMLEDIAALLASPPRVGGEGG